MRRGGGQAFSLSFLDAISCGFGAIVLLLVLTKIGEPVAREEARRGLAAERVRLNERLEQVRTDLVAAERSVEEQSERLAEARQRVASLEASVAALSGEVVEGRRARRVRSIVEERLLAARQSLTEEMERLQARQRAAAERRPRPPDAPVGGVPVDSEYIIFVLDTSGSMQQYAWPAVVRKMEEVLDVYPQVRGIQVMNDMGRYMFSGYAGKWIPDTPGRRRVIVRTLASWKPFSNSSPVEGIERAIRTFAAGDKRVSIYVFGDEFTGDSIEAILEEVRRINTRDASGRPRVRIHAVGFPTIFTVPSVSETTGVRFATLMRELCHENAGTFVALNSAR